MDHIISNELTLIINCVDRLRNQTISEDRALSFLALQYYYFDTLNLDNCIIDIEDCITDGNNDGGIDFVFFDDNEDKIVLGQCKCKEANTSVHLSPTDIITELNKMSTTVESFIEGNTGSYNSRLKRQLQNALDRLTDENAGNVEYCIFTTADIEKNAVINNQHGRYSSEMVNLYQQFDISSRISEVKSSMSLVDYERIRIDKAKNYLSYSSDDSEGIFVNLSSKSLIQLFNKYAEDGLFDLNIRRFISNKNVDDGIQKTLDSNRENFWFLNNGLIIACKDYHIDGYMIELDDFSIVNGGQTTNKIGTYKGSNNQEFFIPCKIIKSKKDKSDKFFNEIAEATNSQKPILPRDLKSNSPEMRILKSWLGKEERIELEIKRGDKNSVRKPKYKIKNDELGQFILSFIFQQPGTSRSRKKEIFNNNDLYNKVFKVNYHTELNQRNFIVSGVDLIYRTNSIISNLKKSQELNDLQREIIKNGTQIIFALLGVIYRLANAELSISQLTQDPKILKSTRGEYNTILNNSYDELDYNLKKIIIDIVRIVSESYQRNSGNPSLKITSISNYFKTDLKYYELIVPMFVENLSYSVGEDIIKNYYIFKN